MYIINVIPISRGITKDSLSYFSALEIKPGTLINIEIRKRKAFGLVVSSEPASDLKTDLKNLPFQIKKAGRLKGNDFLGSEFISAAKTSADFHAATLGSVLNALLPKTILENLDKLKKPRASPKPHLTGEIFAFEAEGEERFTAYRSLVREEFARGTSVFLVLPTTEDVERAGTALSKGIADYTFLLHTELPKKKLLETWNLATVAEHPILIIGTAQFLSLRRNDLGTIIVDKENSRAYKGQARPFLDFRTFAELLTKTSRNRLILAGSLLRTETRYKIAQGDFLPFAPIKSRLIFPSTATVIDMNRYKTSSEGKAGFRIISDELQELIAYNRAKNQHLFIWSGRRGLSPAVVCRDCGTTVLCKNCTTPISLHGESGTDKGRFFYCHRCGEKRDAKERCKHCGSWNLFNLGAGSELVEKEILKTFPELKINRIDSDSTPSPKKAKAELEQFYNSPGGVLVGTDMALFYMDRQVESSAVISVDHFAAIPDFRINERILHILLSIRSYTSNHFVIQTRNLENEVISFATSGNVGDFFRQELERRKEFNYPPFTVLIKISGYGKKGTLATEFTALEKEFLPYELEIFPGFVEFKGGNQILHALIRVPSQNWPDEKLVQKLLALPPKFAVSVNPDTLL